ncbi:MAG: ATP-binding cassette domain-containing protein [Actinomycetota bacterium]
MSSPLLQLRSVAASYGPYRALFNVDLEVAGGETVVLLGANGAGKSTVARVASGLVRASSGTVTFRDVPIGHSTAALAKAGLVHVNEGRAIFSSMTVEDNLRLIGGMGGRAEAKRRIDELFHVFPALSGYRDRKAGTLSGGEQRQLSLMRALLLKPVLLIADEFSLGLSPEATTRLIEHLVRFKEQGTAMVLIESRVGPLLQLADRGVVLARGRSLMSGSVEDAVTAFSTLHGNDDLQSAS